MPQKRATFMVYGTDKKCEDIRSFIEEAGILLDIRDLKKNPLAIDELKALFGHNPLIYFVDPESPDYSRLGLGDDIPDRPDMLKMMAENPGLLRVPIVKTTRLLTVGCDKERIAQVLQISRNGDGSNEGNGNSRAPKITRRALPARK